MIIKNKLPGHYCELSYSQLIEEQLLKEFDNNYSLYFIHPDLDVIEGLNFSEKIKNDINYKIAIHVGNEVSYDPKHYEFFDVIFRFYLQEKYLFIKIKKIFEKIYSDFAALFIILRISVLSSIGNSLLLLSLI